MNITPIQPDSNEREELARLLPAPVERDLPSDRHLQLKEFVMSQIHQDLRTVEQAPRRTPKRRLVPVASALTAVAAIAVAAVAIGTGGFGSSRDASVPPAATVLSGQQILLAAATTAERMPEGSGTYWYVKVVSAGTKNGQAVQWEYWTQCDGQTWFRGDKSNGKMVNLGISVPFRLGGPDVTVEQLQNLPSKPDVLKAWIADALKNSDVRSSAGKLDAAMQERAVFEGLISLVSQLPAPPKVRAAAFQAIASYPNVESLGAVKGGQGLSISFGDATPARLVIDPATSQIRETNFFVSADGSIAWAGGSGADAGSFTLVAEWTNELPK